MNTLAIETSDRFGALALVANGQPAGSRSLPEAMAHGRDLVPAIHDLLKDAEVPPAQVDLVAVDVGPGSYTGLRVGVMAAKTFAFFAQAALIGLGSLRLAIEQVPCSGDSMASPVFVARHRTIYAAAFEPVGGQWVRRHVDTVVSPEDLPGVLPPGSRIFGGALERYGEALTNYERLTDVPTRIGPLTLARLAEDRYEAGERDDPMTLNVAYLRPPRTTERKSAP